MITEKTEIRDKRSALDVAYSQDAVRVPSLKALLVDDGSSILTMLRWYLKNFGCDVTTALRGQSALFELTTEKFDILITDLLVPDLDGSFLLRAGKKLNPQMKVIIITGNPELLPLFLPDVSVVDGLLIKAFFTNGLESLLAKCLGLGVPKIAKQKIFSRH
jgi:CheY-like chemotaxis protein